MITYKLFNLIGNKMKNRTKKDVYRKRPEFSIVNENKPLN